MTAYYNENDPFAAAWLRNLLSDRPLPGGLHKLIASKTVFFPMIRTRQHLQVGEAIVGLVAVFVVYVVVRRDGAMRINIDVPVQILPGLAGRSIVAVGAQCIPEPRELNDINWLGLASQLISPLAEHLVNGLPGYTKGVCHLRETVAAKIEVVHEFCFSVFSWCWHTHIVSKG